jgi:calcium-dependent protein kinase
MIDFGFSKFINSKGRMKTSCGTLAYVAPEVFDRNYTAQCDLWSMGVIVFVLLSGRMPFGGHEDIAVQEDIRRGRYSFKSEHWANVSQTAKDFVKGLLVVDPSKRLTSSTALDHAWLKASFEVVTPSTDLAILGALGCWASAPKLYRACMSMMAWCLTTQQHAEVRDYFLAFDKDHDGVISVEELKEGLGRNFDDDAIRQIFKHLSHGGLDGKIHYSDFLASMVGTHLDMSDSLIHVAFKKFDGQGIGLIKAKDLQSSLDDCDDIEALIQEGDHRGDGKLSLHDFERYLCSTRRKLLAERNTIQSKLCRAVQNHASRNPVLFGKKRPFTVTAVAQKRSHEGTLSGQQGLHTVGPAEIQAKIPPACCVVQ